MLNRLGGDQPRNELHEQTDGGKDPGRVTSGLETYGTLPFYNLQSKEY